MKKTSKHHLNQVIKAGPSPVGDKKKKIIFLMICCSKKDPALKMWYFSKYM